MAIDQIPAWPLRSQGLSQADYSAAVEASLSAQTDFVDQFNAAATLAQLSTTTTSVTSVLIGTGSKSFTVQTGLGYAVGMTLRIANTSTAYMTGDITSYNSGSGALVVNVTAVVGAGTLASWAISLAAVGANTAGAVSFTPAGTIAATNVQAALQELDTEKLSSAAGAVTGTNLEDIIAGASVGSVSSIPVITYDANGRITAVSSASKITVGTPIATTSGTTWDSAAIPSTAKRITVTISGLSSSAGTASWILQLADSGGVEATGYTGVKSDTSGTAISGSVYGGTGFDLNTTSATAANYTARFVLDLSDTNKWVGNGTMARNDTYTQSFSTGEKTLSSTLTSVRFTSTAGANTGDAGSVTFSYE